MNAKNKSLLQNGVLSAVFVALAYVLPFLTGQIPRLGNMLCPMHIPVLLCGFICGPWYALFAGIVSPLLRGLTLGAPPLMPTAVAMAVELASYGVISGVLYRVFKKRRGYIYPSLIIAMICGRLIWGLCYFALSKVVNVDFGVGVFLTSAFVTSLPGITVQIILVPLLVICAEKVLNK